MGQSETDVAYLMRRAGFGATTQRVRELTGLSRAGLIEQLLDDSSFVPPPTPAFVSDEAVSEWEKGEMLREWWIDRMVASTHPLIEKVTLFWHGHFTTAISKVYDVDYLWRMHDAQRRGALGSVRALAQNMAIQPAMLWYLDNDENVAGNPNENFARELLELFLLGIGNYSESDVEAAARAWTGHHLDEDGRTYIFRSRKHETLPSTFMSVTQVWDGPQLIDFLFDDPSRRAKVASYIAKRLWAFFAHPYGQPAAAVEAVAAALLSDGFTLKPALRVLFNRPEFWLPAAREGLVRTPVEYVVNIMRNVGLAAAEAHPSWFLHTMGHSLFNPPNVSGWKPNGYWLSAASATLRHDFASHSHWRLEQLGRAPLDDVPAMDVTRAVSTLFERLGIVAPTANSRDVVTRWLQNQRATRNQGWAEPWMMLRLGLMLPELQIA